MRSSARGKRTSEIWVEAITPVGLWIFVRGEERFLSYRDFPMFLRGTIREILNVQLHGQDHLYWPDLDVDLELESVRHPERYPLVARSERGTE